MVIAQRLAEKGENVTIVEKRSHIGGNCYDYPDDNGILVHQYGPHIFHTDLQEVWEYVNRFSEFTGYEHRVLGSVDGKLLPIPFNFDSIRIAFGEDRAKTIVQALLAHFPLNSKATIVELRTKAQESGDPVLSELAEYVFEKVFKNYTAKQWGISVDEIPVSVISRVPVVIGEDDRYFPHHRYQGMPKEGYTRMFEKMLDSPLIRVVLDTDYRDFDRSGFDRTFFTGPIDAYFDYRYGKLDYRKTLYDMETVDSVEYQPASVVNYPNEHEYTRITEFKRFYPESPSFLVGKTVICREVPGVGEIEAYPIENEENLAILQKYQSDAANIPNLHFLGRLANYKYTDMDKTVRMALDVEI